MVSSPGLEELLAQSVGTRPGPRSQCWAQHLDGIAREYLSAIEAEPLENVYQVKVAEILQTLGVDASTGQVGAHLRRECKCR